MNQEQQLLNVEQLSKVLNVSVSWIYQRTSENRIPFIKVGKYVRFDLDEVIQFLKSSSRKSLCQSNDRPTMAATLNMEGSENGTR